MEIWTHVPTIPLMGWNSYFNIYKDSSVCCLIISIRYNTSVWNEIDWFLFKETEFRHPTCWWVSICMCCCGRCIAIESLELIHYIGIKFVLTWSFTFDYGIISTEESIHFLGVLKIKTTVTEEIWNKSYKKNYCVIVSNDSAEWIELL